MSETLRMLSLSLAAVLVLTLTATIETFCQSPSDQNPSASPSATPRIRSLNQPSQPAPDLARSLGNFSIILPPKTPKEDDNQNPKTTNANDTGAKNDTNANATPPAPNPSPNPPPNPPQGQVSQFSGRSFSRERNAPRRDSLTAIKIIKHVNGLVGGFEQGAGFGLGLEVTTNSEKELKGYELFARALASTRLYRKGEAGVRLGNEKTRGEVWFGYLRRTRDNFFNIGPLTPDINETNYAIEQRSYNGLFAHKFTSKIEGGLYARFTNTGSFKGEDDRDPLIDTLFSGNPAIVPVTNYLPGLNSNVELFSYGAFAELDLRNNDKGLTRGWYLYGRFGSVDGIDNGNSFSDYGWIETELDGRVYIPVFSDKTSVALRAAANLKEPKRGSQIPFYELSVVGGTGYVRGFDTYRFRANNAVVFSGEIRQTVWSMNDENTRGLDLVGFIDTGQVWGDNRSQTNLAILANDDFDTRNYRVGFGGGVVYRLNKTVAFRFDIAASNETTRFYFMSRPGF